MPGSAVVTPWSCLMLYVLAGCLVTLDAHRRDTFEDFDASPADWFALALFVLAWPWVLFATARAFWSKPRA